MALDPTARQSNIVDSIKKYLEDNVYASSGIPVSFDKVLNYPDLRNPKTQKWVAVRLGSIRIEDMSDIFFDIYVCTRLDNQGFVLAQTRDTVMGHLAVDPDTESDGTKRIPFYRSHPTDAWTLIGGLVIVQVNESPVFYAPDDTKFKILTVRLRTASKI